MHHRSPSIMVPVLVTIEQIQCGYKYLKTTRRPDGVHEVLQFYNVASILHM